MLWILLIDELLPLAHLITPNIPEAEQLTEMPITSELEMRQAANIIRGLGARAVLIKGGHLGEQYAEGGGQEAGGRRQEAEGRSRVADSEEVTDTFTLPADSIDVLDNEGRVTVFRERRIPGGELHGSGCILSAAIAAGLGQGMTLEDSIKAAKKFVWEAIRVASAGSSESNPGSAAARVEW